MPDFAGFKAKVDQGLLYNNRYEVICAELGGDTRFLCVAATLPTQSIQ